MVDVIGVLLLVVVVLLRLLAAVALPPPLLLFVLRERRSGAGQAAALQGRVSSRGGQDLPPLLASTLVLRVRFWLPLPPQSKAEQLDQGPQALTTQAVGLPRQQ